MTGKRKMLAPVEKERARKKLKAELASIKAEQHAELEIIKAEMRAEQTNLKRKHKDELIEARARMREKLMEKRVELAIRHGLMRVDDIFDEFIKPPCPRS